MSTFPSVRLNPEAKEVFDRFSLSDVRKPMTIFPNIPAGIPVASHVTVSTFPTVQIVCASGEVIGGSKTVRLSSGAESAREKKKKRHRVIRWDIIADCLNQPTLM